MGKYSNEKWYLEEKNKHLTKDGEIPPHWIVFPDAHPYSIMWRMGGGETFVMVFNNWFDDHYTTEKSRIDFFLKYQPPPRWLGIMASYIWEEVEQENFETSAYIKQIKALGFSGTENYMTDLEDPKWLE